MVSFFSLVHKIYFNSNHQTYGILIIDVVSIESIHVTSVQGHRVKKILENVESTKVQQSTFTRVYSKYTSSLYIHHHYRRGKRMSAMVD